MDSLITTFHIDWKIVIAQAVNFGIVFAVLFFFAIKPLRKLMSERSDKISKGLDDAKANAETLKKISEEYQEHTRNLKKLASDSQIELNKELEKLREKNLERIKTDNEEWTKNRIKQMEVDKIALVESAKKEISDIVLLAMEKITGEKNK